MGLVRGEREGRVVYYPPRLELLGEYGFLPRKNRLTANAKSIMGKVVTGNLNTRLLLLNALLLQRGSRVLIRSREFINPTAEPAVGFLYLPGRRKAITRN